MIFMNVYSAEVLKSDLVKMSGMHKIDSDCYAGDRSGLDRKVVMKKWRRFLFSLMHHHLEKLHLPIRFFWNDEKITVEYVKLLDSIGARCSGLRFFVARSDFIYATLFEPGAKGNPRLQEGFFRTLPRLVNLQVVQIDCFLCGDLALQQFAEHGTNIV
jgi:hypothetical protein